MFLYLWVKIKDADLARINDFAYRLQARPIQVLLKLPVFHKLVRRDVLFEHVARDEVVVLTINLTILGSPTRVCRRRIDLKCYCYTAHNW